MAKELAKRVFAVGLLALLPLMTVQAKLFVPDSDLWAFWATADDANPQQVDHSAWQALLDRYRSVNAADSIARFDYAGVTMEDRELLKAYLNALSGLDPRMLSRAEQRAYWINLYNALTVEVVLRYYPVKSIRKIEGGLFDLGPWSEPYLTIAGQTLTLNDIEHRILRPGWNDPRIHYAVNCASLGCPDLAAEAYTAANTEALLDANARAYINHPRGVTVAGNKATASSIYNWFDVDFGGDEAGVVAHWLQYADAELAAELAAAGDKLKIKYGYDWSLNESVDAD